MEFLIKLQPYLPSIGISLLMAVLIYIAHHDHTNKFDVMDYFTKDGKASTTKTLQILAGLTATWVITKLTVAGTLTVEMFAMYLTAMGVSEAWSKYVNAKFPSKDIDKSE